MENQYPRKGIQVSSEGKNFFSEETRKAPSDGNVGDPSEGRQSPLKALVKTEVFEGVEGRQSPVRT